MGHTDTTIKQRQSKFFMLSVVLAQKHFSVRLWSPVGFGCSAATPTETIRIVSDLSKPSGTESLLFMRRDDTPTEEMGVGVGREMSKFPKSDCMRVKTGS